MRKALLILCVLYALPAAAHPAGVQLFRFVRITDTHIGNGGSNVAAVADRVAAIGRLDPPPAFVINTGDLVDEGTPIQYESYKTTLAPLKMPRYDIPGNHDVRWAPLGKESIQDSMHIPLYRSFDANGCHFVLLDSTVTLEHWGHFDAGELQWMKADLKKTGTSTPVFLFFHHWIGRDSVMVDNEDEFIRDIAPYNVKIVFCGHGHSDIQWRVNGVQYVMERGLYQGSFDEADVTPATVTLYRYRKEDAEPRKLAVIPTAPAGPHFKLRARVVRGHGEEPARLIASAHEISNGAAQGGADFSGARWQWRMDAGDRWQPMDAGSGPASAAATVPLEGMTPGHHVVHVRVVLPLPLDRRNENHDQGGYGGDTWTTFLPLDVRSTHASGPTTESPGMTEVWRKKIGGGVQSKLLYAGGVVFVSSADGSLYAFDASTGRRKWIFATAGSLYGTPLLSGGLMYIASMDHFAYALDPGTGALRWRTRLGGPVFAGMQAGDGIACVGAGDDTIYGLDANTGKVKWTCKTKGFIQQQAAFGEDAFYVGAWDNGFYAVEARTGKVRWRKQFGRSFFYSPSIGAPAVYGGNVYVPSDDDTLHAVVMQTGEVAWEKHSPDGAGSYGYSGPAITPDGRIYIAALGEAGSVMCLDAASGELLWRSDTGSVIYDSSCAVAGPVVAVGSVDGTFHALDRASGKSLGSFRLGPGHLLASPAMAPGGGMVYIGSLGNVVTALRIDPARREGAPLMPVTAAN